MTRKNSFEDDRGSSRRKILKGLATGGAVLTIDQVLPDKWVKPIADIIVLPAHAQTSGAPPIEPTDPPPPVPGDPPGTTIPGQPPPTTTDPVQPPTPPPKLCDYSVMVSVTTSQGEVPRGCTMPAMRATFTVKISPAPSPPSNFLLWILKDGVVTGGTATAFMPDSNGEFSGGFQNPNEGTYRHTLVVRGRFEPYQCAIGWWSATVDGGSLGITCP